MLNTGLFRSTDGQDADLLPAPMAIITVSGSIAESESHDQLERRRGDDLGRCGKNWSTQYNQPTAQFYHVRRTTISL